jgi:hypothetical protein
VSHPVATRLRSSDPDERRDAATAAAEDPSAVLLVDALVGALGDPVRAVSRAASDSLVAIAARDAGALPALRTALRSDDPVRRRNAAFTHARLRPPEPRLLPTLVEALGCEDGHARWRAARLLVESARSIPEAGRLLAQLAGAHGDPVVRRMASHCLRRLAPDDPAVARALLSATRDADVRTRRAALAALAALLAPPPAVAERLREALASESDAASRRIASVALGALGSANPDCLCEDDLAALRRARDDDPDPDLRRGAARALARLGAA